MSSKPHSLTTYVQKTLMQFLPSMGSNKSNQTNQITPKSTTSPSSSTSTSKAKSTNSKKATVNKSNSKKKTKANDSDTDDEEEKDEDEEEDDDDDDESEYSTPNNESDSDASSSSSSSTPPRSKSKSTSKSKSQSSSNKKAKRRRAAVTKNSPTSKSTYRSSTARSASKSSSSRSRSSSPVAISQSRTNSKSHSKSTKKSTKPRPTASSTSPLSSPVESVNASSDDDDSDVMTDASPNLDESQPSNHRGRHSTKSHPPSKKRKITHESADGGREDHMPSPSSLTSSMLNPSPICPISSDDEADIEPDRRQPSKVKHIDYVQIGKYELTTWYHSPYPDPYRTAKKLFICEFCLKYCQEYKSLVAHMKECTMRHPPGKLIYHDGINSVFEVNGAVNKLYCQCLALFAKLFIDHKTLYFDVDPFLFYVLTESVPNSSPSSSSLSSSQSSSSSSSSSSSMNSCRSPPSSPSSLTHSTHQVVAYFSKEKLSPDQFNLSCILTFPQYQRRGYGKFLISLSYELSRRENRIGSPEKPLSELGKVSYRSYWVNEILKLLSSNPKNHRLSIVEICNRTAIKKEDCISALESVGLIQYTDGEHHLDCESKHGKMVLEKYKAKSAEQSNLSEELGLLEFRPDLLNWQPNPASLSSPSVAFPPTPPTTGNGKGGSAKKTQSHAKKRIKY